MSSAMQQKWVLAGSACFVLLAGSAAWVQFRKSASARDNTRQSVPAPVPTVTEIKLAGEIQARQIVKVTAPIEGKVVAFHAEVGAEVYEGQLLAELVNESLDVERESAASELGKAQERVNNLDSAIASARLEESRAGADASRARSEFELASRHFDRQKMLMNEGATPRQVLERAEREFKALQIEADNLAAVAQNAAQRVAVVLRELDSAKKQLEGKGSDLESASARVDAGHVISPVSGVVAGRRGSAGDIVHPAMEDLFQIATDLSNLSVIVEPRPDQFLKIKPGQSALITVADVPEALSGVVKSAENGKVTIDFGNPSPLVKPGQTAQVRIGVT
ncbi:MAG: efflux RND transporter periplasmic adaptor subunit [Bryobacteraceae bacterium]|nr:efflux RND transporter periplasmic adaptor subunit [Bryobacteraceae bacterium]